MQNSNPQILLCEATLLRAQIILFIMKRAYPIERLNRVFDKAHARMIRRTPVEV